MKRDDYALIAEARDYCRSVPAPITRTDLATKVFERFPGLWELLTPGRQEAWAWEQRRSAKDDGQLPLDGIDGGLIVPRADWGDDLWRRQAQRYFSAAQKNLRLLERLKAEYYQQRHEQLMLDFEIGDE